MLKRMTGKASDKVLLLFLCFLLLLTGCNNVNPSVTSTVSTPIVIIDVPLDPSSYSTSDNISISPDTITTVSESKAISEDTTVSEDVAISEDTTVSKDTAASESKAVVYKEGFFYEPLSPAVKQRITGISYPAGCTVPYDDLRYLNVQYIGFDGKTATGELICNKSIADNLLEIFYELYVANYPIGKMKLIDEYGGDDTLSMYDNNTSCFNYRVVEGTDHLSKHALGLAIDLNPYYNPYVTYPGGKMRVSPEPSAPYADRTADFVGKISHEDLCYQLFHEHGFTWGGDWKTLKDYQHFQISK